MAYAGLQQLSAAAGKVSAYWHDSSTPNDADLESFLDDGTALVDAALAARGISTPVADAIASGALRPVVVDYALVRALDATFPGGAPSDEITKSRDAAEARWNAWLESVKDGSADIITVLDTGPSVPLATSFWREEPDYGRTGSVARPGDDNYRLAPYITRGDVL